MSKADKEPPTRDVTILLLPQSSIMTLASVLDPLRAANRLSRRPLFKWRIKAFADKPIPLTCGIDIDIDGVLNERDQGEILIIIAGFNYQEHITHKGLQTLRRLSTRFEKIFAIEAGTWVLAQAGIITHHSVTTHWEDVENLAQTYLSLDVRKDRYVIDGHIWSSGGASPSMDMMLHYIRSTHNKSLALDVASVFIYNETTPPTHSQPNVSLGRIHEMEPRLADAIGLMEAQLEDPYKITDLAKKLGISIRNLEKLSQNYLGTSPGAYYLRLRLQAARKLVLDTTLSILEISIRTGFKSQTSFARAFKRRFGTSAQGLRRLQNEIPTASL